MKTTKNEKAINRNLLIDLWQNTNLAVWLLLFVIVLVIEQMI